MNLYTTGNDTITAIGYDSDNNYIWLHDNNITGSVGTNNTLYLQINNQSSFAYPNFPTSGTHSLLTSRIDTGFRRILKSMPSMLVEAENLSPTCYINVYFQVDNNGKWLLWGKVNQTGVTELVGPAGSKTYEWHFIQLRFDFITADSTQSPILDSYTVRFIVRPDVKRGYNFNIIAADNLESEGRQDLREAQEIEEDLWAIRSSAAPVKFIDLLGAERYVYLTAFKEMPTFYEGSSDDRSELPSVPVITSEYQINVNLVEV